MPRGPTDAPILSSSYFNLNRALSTEPSMVWTVTRQHVPAAPEVFQL